MSDKVCVIKQPAGIGDIFFCQKIAQSVREETEYKSYLASSINIFISERLYDCGRR